MLLQIGRRSIAIGPSALKSWDGTPSSSDQTVIGVAAFEHLQTGSYNTGVGALAGRLLTNAGNNVFIGTGAGEGIVFGQTGVDSNTFIGSFAGFKLKTGSSRNIGIGHDTGNTSIGSGTDNILIGDNIQLSVADSNSNLNIGDILFGSGVGTTAGSKIGAVEYCDETLTTCTLAANLGAAADNLGNHIATKAVDMASFDINNGGIVNMQKALFTPIAALAPTK